MVSCPGRFRCFYEGNCKLGISCVDCDRENDCNHCTEECNLNEKYKEEESK